MSLQKEHKVFASPGRAAGRSAALRGRVADGRCAFALSVSLPRLLPLLLLGALVPGGVRAQQPEAGRPLQQPDTGQIGQAAVVDSIEIQGNERLRDAVLRSQLGIQPGDRITYVDVQKAIHRLWSLGQLKDVSAAAQPVGTPPSDHVRLVFHVEERPFVSAVLINGLEHVSASTVRDTVKLKSGEVFDPEKVARARTFTRQALAGKGIWLKKFDYTLEPLNARPGEYRLVIDVQEGNRVSVAQVEFEGNRVFSDDELRGAMGTKPEGFFWFRTGQYDEEQLRSDLRKNLPDLYGSRGYIDFAVGDDSLVVDPETGKAKLVVRVEEGPQYVLNDFTVVGNHRFSESELERYFRTPSGGLLQNLGITHPQAQRNATPFDRTAFQKATDEVRRLYSNYGYLWSQVEPIIDKTTTADGRQAVDIAWQITEGQPAYVNKVAITGNTYTHEDVIRDRIYILPGDVYSEDALIQSYQAISGLGFFETPLPTPKIEPTDSGDVNITFEVKEKQTGSVNFGTALGGYGGVAGFLGYDQPNLFGQAKSGHLRWEFGKYTNNFEASYSDPAILGSRYSGSLSLFSARNSFGQAFRFSQGQYRRTGGSVQFGFPLPQDRFTRATIGYSLVRTNYSQFDPTQTSTLFELPPSTQSSVTFGLLRNTLNHTLFPTAGTRTQLQASLNGGLLGGDGSFQKYIASGSWYIPIGQAGGAAPGARPIRFTLGLTAEMGALMGDASRFPFERFWMGGVQFGQSLRGYDETTITPLGYFDRGSTAIPLESRLGDAYLRMSAEYAVRMNDNLSVSAFYDAGNVWSDPGAINPTRLFRGAGFGLTLVTPFGPLGLDYAYGFDKPNPGWQLHFKLGQVF